MNPDQLGHPGDDSAMSANAAPLLVHRREVKLACKDDLIAVRPYQFPDVPGLKLPELMRWASFISREEGPDGKPANVVWSPMIAEVICAGPGEVNREATTALFTHLITTTPMDPTLAATCVGNAPVRWPMPHKAGDLVILGKPGVMLKVPGVGYEDTVWLIPERMCIACVLEMVEQTRPNLVIPEPGAMSRLANAAGRA